MISYDGLGKRKSRRGRNVTVAGVTLATALTAMVGASVPNFASAAAAVPAVGQGGDLKVLEQGEAAGTWSSLDPTTTNGFIYDYLNSIYGNLFEEGANGKVIPDLATNYSLTNSSKKLTIHLRQGVKFTDGTPFNAAAVKFNIQRDLEPKFACACDAEFKLASIQTPNPSTVVLNLENSYAPIVQAFFNSAPNWIASPTALKKEGAAGFAKDPVGAGPFEIQSDNFSSQLVLKRNPNYWEKGHPYLNTVTFLPIANVQSALEALYSNEDQVYLILMGGSVSLIPQIKAHGLKIYSNPAVTNFDVQLDTLKPPFNNIKAREALYYATNVPPITQHLFDNYFPVTQSPEGPGSDFPDPKVQGYRSYDPAKAKALVKQLGGSLNFTVDTYQSTGLEDTADALVAEWKAVGINATVKPLASATVVSNYGTHNWQAFMGGAGGLDPALTGGLNIYFASDGTESGVHDPKLDKLLAAGAAISSHAKRAAIYKHVDQYLSQQAYAVFVASEPVINLSLKNVNGMTDHGDTPWQDVYLTK